MGHVLSGLVGLKEPLESVARRHDLEAPAVLAAGFAFLPLDARNLDRLADMSGESAEGFTYLTTSLVDVVARESRGCAIAYIETEYFGGIGCQGAVLARDGVVRSGPRWAKGSINEALALMGVPATGTRDPFDIVELGRYRKNDDARRAI